MTPEITTAHATGISQSSDFLIDTLFEFTFDICPWTILHQHAQSSPAFDRHQFCNESLILDFCSYCDVRTSVLRQAVFGTFCVSKIFVIVH